MNYELSHLASPEAEAVHVLREVAATFERPVLLFSGGKDSMVMLHLAAKAFWPARLPFPVMHIDTGHNFDEVIEFRDQVVHRLEVRLVVSSVQDDIEAGRVVEDPTQWETRNRLQTTTLLRVIREHGFDAIFGGVRRDEEKARAKNGYSVSVRWVLHGPMTASPNRVWRIARKRATSDDEVAPPGHCGQHRRREVHVDRALTVRLQSDL